MNSIEPIRVLLIEDSKTDGRLIEIMLGESEFSSYELKQAHDLATGLNLLSTFDFDVILLDLGLPDSQGLETISSTAEQAVGIPIIVLTGLHDEELAMKAAREHVQEYLVKGEINSDLLEHAINYAIARKQTEDELRESREEWKGMFLSISDSVLILSPSHEILFANPASEKITGLTLDELTGRLCHEIFHESDAPPEECPMTRLLASEQPQTMEMEMQVVSGSFLVTVAPLFDSQGKLSRVIHIAKDITERKQAEREIRESESKYRSLFESMSEAFAYHRMIYDDDGRPSDFEFLEINKAFEEFTGLKENDVIGSRVTDLIPGIREADPDLIRIYGEVASTGKEVSFDLYFEPLKKWYWISAYSPKRDYFVVVFNDVTERKMTEENLRRSEEKYRTLFEESKDVVFISSSEGRFLDINAAGMELFGYFSKEELLKVDMARDIYEDPAEGKAFQQQLEDKGFVKDHEIQMVKRDGARLHVLVTATAETDESGNIITYRGILHDMTEHRILEQQLLRAQRMESIGRLAGGVAHDFNNFLTAVVGYIDMAMMELGEDSEACNDLAEARRAAERAANLTRQLLLFSRRETMDLKPVSLNAVISDLLKMLSQLLGEKYEVLVNTDRDLWPARADIGHLEQVLMNLCVNARDAMPDGGTITIKTVNASINKKYSELHSGACAGKFVHLSVTDTGVGMDDETISHIFEPFFSTKEAREGTGLGLSVVYGIVNQHGGWVEVNSAPNAGSTFDIFIPAIAAESEEAGDVSPTPEELGGHGEKILLVEDEEAIRGLALKVLEKNAYKVVGAGNAHEAMALYHEDGGDFQLVFSDVVLPGDDGISLVERILSENPGIGVLLTSSYSEESDWEKIHKQGYSFLQKPYSSHDLLKAIRRQIDVDTDRGVEQ